MIALLAVALLPLDLADPAGAAPAGALRLAAVVEDDRLVAAELENVGARPLRVVLGYTCGGPEPFEALVDGAARPFVPEPRPCDKNVLAVETLPPRGRRRVASASVVLDGRPHRVAVRYRPPNVDGAWMGALISPAIAVGAGPLAIELKLRPGPVRDGERVDLEIVHTWRGPTQMRFLKGWYGVCGGPLDQLTVDDQPTAFRRHVNCDGPVMPEVVVLQPGGSWTTTGSFLAAPGRHRVRVRYLMDASLARAVDRPDNVGTWLGEVGDVAELR